MSDDGRYTRWQNYLILEPYDDRAKIQLYRLDVPPVLEGYSNEFFKDALMVFIGDFLDRSAAFTVASNDHHAHNANLIQTK